MDEAGKKIDFIKYFQQFHGFSNPKRQSENDLMLKAVAEAYEIAISI